MADFFDDIVVNQEVLAVGFARLGTQQRQLAGADQHPGVDPVGQPSRQRVITGWRVGQYVQMTTTSLDKLPKTVAAVQKLLALNNLQFGLTPETTRQLDEARIAAAYRNLHDRVAFMAKAMGRSASDAVLEAVDFEGTGNFLRENQYAAAPAMMLRSAKMADQAEVAEPSFEPGETTVQVGLVAKVRFK